VRPIMPSRYKDPTKHDSPEFAAIAWQGTILRCQVGSGLHGTAVRGQDDRDEMGICVEPPEYEIGLGRFEQYMYRTQPEGVRSGPGDLDPTVLLPLFVPAEEVVRIDDLGRELRENAHRIVSRQAGHRFLGYSRAQRERMLGTRAARTNRPELIEKYGFDTKFAMHMVRLGVQGVELLETGRITLPVPEPRLTWLCDLRQRRHTEAEALEAAGELERRLEKLIGSSLLSERPDTGWANSWLVRAHREAWQAA
jgi:hypothetical protein